MISWIRYYRDWLFGKKTLSNIAEHLGISVKTVQRHFNAITLDEAPLPALGHATPLVIDATFFGREWGLFCFHDTHRVAHVIEIKTESVRGLYDGFYALADAGYHFTSITLDGKPGFISAIRRLYPHLPIQMCHFHQQAIVRRHLLHLPDHPAKQELQVLMRHLKGDAQSFIDRFYGLMTQYEGFLQEKKPNGKFRRRKLRAAYRSVQQNLPYLFVYQELKHVNVPNTTNHLEGAFGHMKKHLALHQGLNQKHKKKAAIFLLKYKNTSRT